MIVPPLSITCNGRPKSGLGYHLKVLGMILSASMETIHNFIRLVEVCHAGTKEFPLPATKENLDTKVLQ